MTAARELWDEAYDAIKATKIGGNPAAPDIGEEEENRLVLDVVLTGWAALLDALDGIAAGLGSLASEDRGL